MWEQQQNYSMFLKSPSLHIECLGFNTVKVTKPLYPVICYHNVCKSLYGFTSI